MLVVLAAMVLLGAEWRYRLKSVRIAAVLFALLVLFVAQPMYHRAWRVAVTTPPAQRVTDLRGRKMPEYMSGVSTMERAVEEDTEMGAGSRGLALGLLVWLACSPVVRRERGPSPAA